jgi:hypothetical protein
MRSTPQPFQVNIDQAAIDDLRARLQADTLFPREVPATRVQELRSFSQTLRGNWRPQGASFRAR